MGFGLKRFFKKKSKPAKAASTPAVKKGVPTTPPTEPIKQKAVEHDIKETPVQELLEDLNIHTSGEGGAGETELVLGEWPDDEPPSEPTYVPYNPDGLPPRDTEEAEEVAEETPAKEAEPATVAPPSPMVPRKLEDLPDDTDAPVESMDEEDAAEDDAAEDDAAEGDNATDEPESVARQLLSALQNAASCVSTIPLPEPVEKLIPTADNALLPALSSRSRSELSRQPTLERQYSYYNEQFALKILDELMNVGYALVNHEQLLDEDDDAGDWIGRSVTLLLRPGVCNEVQVDMPYLEWSTMGGGQQKDIESIAISLMDIDSITASSAIGLEEEEVDDEDDDMDCFFTLTTKQGDVHVMEAITPDESQRLVAGIKNLTARISSQLLSGDVHILSDFFDNSQEPDEIRFTPDEAMLRLSHAYFDTVSPDS